MARDGSRSLRNGNSGLEATLQDAHQQHISHNCTDRHNTLGPQGVRSFSSTLPLLSHKHSQIIGHIRTIRRSRAKPAPKKSTRTTFPKFSLPPCAVDALHALCRAEPTVSQAPSAMVPLFCGSAIDLCCGGIQVPGSRSASA